MVFKHAAQCPMSMVISLGTIHIGLMLALVVYYVAVREAVVTSARRQLPGYSKEEALTVLMTGKSEQANRELFITNKDVLNLRAKLEQAQYRIDNNDAESVRQFCSKHQDKVRPAS